MTAGKPEKDGAAEGTAGERQKDAVIATDLATALLATALASAQRLHEVRRCQRVCAVTKMMKHVLSKPCTIRLGVPGPPRYRAPRRTAGGRASGGEREGCGQGWQIRRRRASATDGERDGSGSRSAQAARARGRQRQVWGHQRGQHPAQQGHIWVWIDQQAVQPDHKACGRVQSCECGDGVSETAARLTRRHATKRRGGRTPCA